MNCFYCIFILYIAGLGVNPGEQTMYIYRGGDLEIKIYKINSFSLFYFMSKMLKIQCMECNALNGTHVEDVKDIKNTCC